MAQALVAIDRMTHTAQTQADSDQQLIAPWLHGHPTSTQAAYTADVA